MIASIKSIYSSPQTSKKETSACWDRIDAHCHNDKEIERSRPDLTEFVDAVFQHGPLISLLFGFFKDDPVRQVMKLEPKTSPFEFNQVAMVEAPNFPCTKVRLMMSFNESIISGADDLEIAAKGWSKSTRRNNLLHQPAGNCLMRGKGILPESVLVAKLKLTWMSNSPPHGSRTKKCSMEEKLLPFRPRSPSAISVSVATVSFQT